jgi:hypothetical protein
VIKQANHGRIVFIELNAPDDCADDGRPFQFKTILQSLRTRDKKLTILGKPAPSAYVVITNNPAYSVLDVC